jgi:hypothetical protein
MRHPTPWHVGVDECLDDDGEPSSTTATPPSISSAA